MKAKRKKSDEEKGKDCGKLLIKWTAAVGKTEGSKRRTL